MTNASDPTRPANPWPPSAASSADLHPEHGARFELVLRPGEPTSYAVTVYLPGSVRVASTLTWDDRGQPRFDPGLSDPWVQGETIKLARVLKRTLPPRLLRWRGRSL